jgi:hypothetical protein
MCPSAGKLGAGIVSDIGHISSDIAVEACLTAHLSIFLILKNLHFCCYIAYKISAVKFMERNSGLFLNETISHHQLPLNLIFISERPGFWFFEAIFRLFRIQEQNGLYVITGEGLPLYMCKIFIQFKIT